MDCYIGPGKLVNQKCSPKVLSNLFEFHLLTVNYTSVKGPSKTAYPEIDDANFKCAL